MYYTLNNQSKALKNFSYDLANLILEKENPPIFLCVGNGKIVDDSLGTLVGELLTKHYNINHPVFGNFSNMLFGQNLDDALYKIKIEHYNKTVVVIDSCIGNLNNLYNISLNPFGLNINYTKSNKLVGNISIGSVTHINGITNLLLLNSERKKCVFKCANFIACGIYNALKIYEKLAEKEAI